MNNTAGWALAIASLLGCTASAPAAEVAITAHEFAFEPKTVTVPHGEPVVLVLENMGVLAHNLEIEALDTSTGTIQADNATTLEFTAPDEPGTYEIICTVPGHEDAGMRATLKVE